MLVVVVRCTKHVDDGGLEFYTSCTAIFVNARRHRHDSFNNLRYSVLTSIMNKDNTQHFVKLFVSLLL